MPDLDHYRRRYPELSEEQIEALRRTLRGIAREVVATFNEQTKPDEGRLCAESATRER